MRRILALGCLLVCVVAPALAQDAAPTAFSHRIAPGKIAEECLKIEAGRIVDYRFDADAQVDFNIHYHRGKEVFYPVKVGQTTRQETAFTPRDTEEFCLMWSNKTQQPVIVEGILTRR